MAGNITWLRGTWQTMMTTELNSLAAATGVLQNTATNVAFDNTQATPNGLFFWFDAEVQLTYAVAPTAGKTVDLYCIPLSSTGGTTYWDGSATIQQATLFVGSFVLRNLNTLQILGLRNIPLPAQKVIFSLVNNGDQALSASGNTLKIFPVGEAYT